MNNKALIVIMMSILVGTTSCTPPENGTDINKGGRGTSSASGKEKSPIISIDDVSITEGSNGSTRTFSIPLRISPSTTEESSVTWRTRDMTAKEGADYIASSGRLVIPAGQRKALIEIQVIGDDIDEPQESFKVELSDPENIGVGDGESVVTIGDDDPEPTVRFGESRIVVSENSGGAKIELLLSSPSSLDITIPLEVTGTAQKGSDYKIDTDSVLIPSGRDRQEVSIDIIHDSIPEGGETIKLSMGSPVFAVRSKDGADAAIIIKGDVALPDTGVVHYTNLSTSNSLTAAPSGYDGQDADYGRDTLPGNSELDGASGFSFVKLDYAGNPLSPSADHWSCVKDMNTGLVWEVKGRPYHPAADATLPIGAFPNLVSGTIRNWYNTVKERVVEKAKRDKSYTVKQAQKDLDESFHIASHHYHSGNYQYTWFNDEAKTNGGSPGSYVEIITRKYYFGDGTIFESDDKARNRSWKPGENTQVLANELSLFAHCGMKNWRLPTIQELKGIANYDPVFIRSNGSVIQKEYFPFGLDGLYLSATPSSDGNAEVLCMDTRSGDIKYCNKQVRGYYARMVRNEENGDGSR